MKDGDPNTALVPSDGETVQTLLRWSGDETLRRRAFIEGGQAYEDNIRLLDRLVSCRHAYARLMGFPSYSHFQISSQMARVR
jgi:Zn-dependent oligopeptidase